MSFLLDLAISLRKWCDQNVEDFNKKMEQKVNYYDRYSSRELKRMYKKDDSLSNIDKEAIKRVLLDRKERGLL